MEGLASGSSSLVLHLNQVGHVICKTSAKGSLEEGEARLPSHRTKDQRLPHHTQQALLRLQELGDAHL